MNLNSADGEIYGEKLALSPEFLENLLSHYDRVDESLMDPPSPFTLPFVHPIAFVEFSDDFYYKASDSSDSIFEDSYLEMEVPDPDSDFEFSFDVGSSDPVDCDNSIIQHW